MFGYSSPYGKQDLIAPGEIFLTLFKNAYGRNNLLSFFTLPIREKCKLRRRRAAERRLL